MQNQTLGSLAKDTLRNCCCRNTSHSFLTLSFLSQGLESSQTHRALRALHKRSS